MNGSTRKSFGFIVTVLHFEELHNRLVEGIVGMDWAKNFTQGFQHGLARFSLAENLDRLSVACLEFRKYSFA